VGLAVIGPFVLLFAGLSACFAIRPLAQGERADPAIARDGTRVVTLLRNPRLPPASDAAHLRAAGDNLPALVDGRIGETVPVWQSVDGRLPIDLQFAAGETGRGGRPIPALAGRLVFAHSSVAPPETWAKDVEVWVSLTPDQDDRELLGRWTLEQRTGAQLFVFARRPVWGLWLRILSNYGSAEFTSLAEFALLPAGM
jgi:hypothetical protein